MNDRTDVGVIIHQSSEIILSRVLFIFGENPEDVKNFHFQLEEANGVNFSLTSSLKYSC